MKIVQILLGLSLLGGGVGRPLRLFDHMAGVEINSSVSSLVLPADGKITGSVFFSKAAGSSNRASKGLYGKSTSRLTQGGGGDKRAVVYVSRMAGRFGAQQAHPAMRQKNVSIVPRVLPIVAGTTVDFPNEDDIYHNIFSLSATTQFDLGRYAKGISKSVKFNTVGSVKVFCDIHSSMGGVILVLQNPYYTLTNADGSYALSGVPPGSYDVVAWQENGGTQTQKVTIGAGETVSQNFSF